MSEPVPCWESVGPASRRGPVLSCPREASHEAFFLREWRPLCRYHVRNYYDLPVRRITVSREAEASEGTGSE